MIPVGIDKPLIRKPYVTLSLMAVNALIEAVKTIDGSSGDFIVSYGVVHGHACLLTLFSHMFVHADFLHLLGNMFFFAVAGLKTEDSMGPWRFLLFYLGCGVAADLVNALLSGPVPIPTVGASGAIAGVLGGFMVLYPRNYVKIMNIFPHFIMELPAVVFLGFWIIREIIYLMIDMKSGGFGGVAFGAHVGGFLAGAVWAWAFYGWSAGDWLDEEAFDEAVQPVFVASDYDQWSKG